MIGSFAFTFKTRLKKLVRDNHFRGRPHKTFFSVNLFCKLDLFIVIQQILPMFIK
jgi:hypothetical protein